MWAAACWPLTPEGTTHVWIRCDGTSVRVRPHKDNRLDHPDSVFHWVSMILSSDSVKSLESVSKWARLCVCEGDFGCAWATLNTRVLIFFPRSDLMIHKSVRYCVNIWVYLHMYLHELFIYLINVHFKLIVSVVIFHIYDNRICLWLSAAGGAGGCSSDLRPGQTLPTYFVRAQKRNVASRCEI